MIAYLGTGWKGANYHSWLWIWSYFAQWQAVPHSFTNGGRKLWRSQFTGQSIGTWMVVHYTLSLQWIVKVRSTSSLHLHLKISKAREKCRLTMVGDLNMYSRYPMVGLAPLYWWLFRFPRNSEHFDSLINL